MQFNKVILFDIDYTLFDAKKFREKILLETIKTVGDKKSIDNTKRKVQDLYIASRRATGFFDQSIFIKDLIGELNLNTNYKVLAKAIFNESIFRGNLYKETKQVLGLLSRNKLFKIGIFSTGYDSFQRKKIKEIKDLLNLEHIHIFIFKDKELSNLIKRYRGHKLYLVDDFLDILYKARKLNKNVFTVWIKRGDRALLQKPIPGFAPDATITSLKEVIKLVQ